MKLIIVGGVAGGASAAARARRLSEEAEIILFERGPDVSFANCGLPYYLGGTISQREKLLVTTAQRLHERFNLDVRTLTSVEAIDRAARKVRVPRTRYRPRVRRKLRQADSLPRRLRRSGRRFPASTCPASIRCEIWMIPTRSRPESTGAFGKRPSSARVSSGWRWSKTSSPAASPRRSWNCRTKSCLRWTLR